MFRKADRAWIVREAAAIFSRYGIATAPPPYPGLTGDERIEAETFIIGGATAYASISVSDRLACFHLGHNGEGEAPMLRSVPGYNTGAGWQGQRSHKWNEYAAPALLDRMLEAQGTLAGLDAFLKVNKARGMTPDEREAYQRTHAEQMRRFDEALSAKAA
jgi:hypothetical protein